MKLSKLKIRNALFTLLILTGASNYTFAQKKQRTEKAIIKTHFYCDHCKKCETCGLKFEAELYNTKGIRAFEINDKKQTITVIYNPLKVDLQAIKIAISKLGFDADEIKADPIAYNKLDDCCKK